MVKPREWTPAYVGLGSNLDEPLQQIAAALAAIARLPDTRVECRSRLFRNPPFGVTDQPDFVNGVAGVLTGLPPIELLRCLKRIEQSQGRDPAGPRWGPRTIDLDLLMHGAWRIDSPDLGLPHPGIARRNFVLFPLLEIAPTLEVPGVGSLSSLAAALDAGGLVAVG
ncbi:MAG: 2-amino-4-hydroxy-6-hydroxymethyldihydropteridine diphosphokinase [Gammaproteobacteria bacterium]|nr:2-amino-4-hydroxy-6-hydroxymethyldihydropteridine diphosphokinase [Gammaproteobacteria bacterium]